MRYIILETKTDAGKRKIPITDDVAAMFQAVFEDREAPAVEKIIDGYTGFLFYDKEEESAKTYITGIVQSYIDSTKYLRSLL